ncbi:MAG: nuclear transport factor 2 family protein [Caulobacteraceae bacterium]
MKKLLLVAVSLLVVGVRPALAAPSVAVCAPAAAATAERVGGVVQSLFRTLAADQDEAAAALLTPEFYAFDGGKRSTGPELLEIIRDLHAQGVVLEWNPEPIDVHISCNMAWAAWDNHGRVGKAGALSPVSWQESAVLRWREGAWRIAFLHSNRVEAK